jgi:nicotinate-nucleotide adenylyltransferase
VSEERLRRIGVYGGTFDPVHKGHLKVAEAVLNAFTLERMLFVPAFTPPHKRKRVISSPFHRLAMMVLATEQSPKMFVSTVELEAPSQPYTIETLGRLRNELQPARLFFLMGADSFRDITTWHKYEEILSGYDVVVATRPGNHGFENEERLEPRLENLIVDLRGGGHPSTEDLKSPRIYLTDYVAVDLSATGVREAVQQARPIDDLVPPAVAAYIEKYQLYRKA